MMKWPRPPPASHNKQKPDIPYQKLSDAFRCLRQYEHNTNLSQHSQLVSLLLKHLLKRRNFVDDATFWTELYARNTWHYPFIHRFIGLPFVNVTKHNHILSFYMPLFASRPDLADIPIVHFDSHDDNNPIYNSKKLPDLFSKYKISLKNNSVNERPIADAQALVWDIGAAISGVLLTTGIRPFVWVMPEWLPDQDYLCEYGIYDSGRDFVLGHNVRSKSLLKMSEDIPLKAFRSKSPAQCSRYAQIHDPRGDKTPSNALINFLADHNSYILDVDLDYFSCNGNPDLRQIDDDLASPHRIPYLEMIAEPRQVFSKNNKTYISQKRLVDLELKHIDARIYRFKHVLTDLQRAGKSPAIISISDSTGLNFTDCTDCASVTNQYVSSHMALYIRTKVLRTIELVCR